jgi:hypothetical protein
MAKLTKRIEASGFSDSDSAYAWMAEQLEIQRWVRGSLEDSEVVGGIQDLRYSIAMEDFREGNGTWKVTLSFEGKL